MNSLQKYNADQRLAYWTDAISRCRNSGMTVIAWCAQEGISSKTYYYWQRKIYHAMTEESSTGFVEILPPSSTNFGTTVAEISANGFVASIHSGADTPTLQNLLLAMKSC